MSAVRIIHPLDGATQSTQCEVHLARVQCGDIMVFATGHEQQRRANTIGKHDGTVCNVLLWLLPHGCADTILRLFRSIDVAHSKSGRVGVEGDEIDFAGDVDCRLEAVGLRHKQVGCVATITCAVHAQFRTVGDSHLDQLVG